LKKSIYKLKGKKLQYFSNVLYIGLHDCISFWGSYPWWKYSHYICSIITQRGHQIDIYFMSPKLGKLIPFFFKGSYITLGMVQEDLLFEGFWKRQQHTINLRNMILALKPFTYFVLKCLTTCKVKTYLLVTHSNVLRFLKVFASISLLDALTAKLFKYQPSLKSLSIFWKARHISLLHSFLLVYFLLMSNKLINQTYECCLLFLLPWGWLKRVYMIMSTLFTLDKKFNLFYWN